MTSMGTRTSSCSAAALEYCMRGRYDTHDDGSIADREGTTDDKEGMTNDKEGTIYNEEGTIYNKVGKTIRGRRV